MSGTKPDTAMIQLIPQIVWTHTPAGETTYFNERWYGITGVPRTLKYDEMWERTLFPSDKEVLRAFLKTGGNAEIRIKIGNEYRWHLAQCQPGQFVNTLTDIHDIKLNEIKLLEKMEHMAIANRELEMFAYVAAHDLQDPLRRITALLRIMFKKLPDDENIEQYRKLVFEAADGMKTMTSNLLEYARDSNKALHPTPCDIGKIVFKVIGTMSEHIREAEGTVVIKDLPTDVLCDETQVGRVWQNLIKNAIKYRRNTPPKIEVGFSNGTFYVKDNGKGVTKADAEKLFVVYRRLQQDDKGVGFGLAICKKIVERHGGKIWVESKPNVGSTFYFTLGPVAKEGQGN